MAQNSHGTTYGYAYSFTTGSQSTTAPVAAFTSSPAAAAGSAVSFDASGSADSGATIIDYSWNFGDGTPVDDAMHTQPPATLHQPGHLQRHADRHQQPRRERDHHPDRDGRLDPTAAFSVPTQPTPGTATTFDASASTDSVGTITDYSWNFGDGTPSTTPEHRDHHPHLRDARHLHRHADRHQRRRADRDVHHTITVDDPPAVTISPTVAVTTPGSTVSFNASASAPDAGGTITGYSWNFGDPSSANNTSTATNPSHSSRTRAPTP